MSAAGEGGSRLDTGRSGRRRQVAGQTAARVLVGAARGVWYWPGMVALVAAYGAVAGGLYSHAYSNLLGGLAAAAVGLAWYASPLRGWEARRRQAGLGGRPAPEGQPSPCA